MFMPCSCPVHVLFMSWCSGNEGMNLRIPLKGTHKVDGLYGVIPCLTLCLSLQQVGSPFSVG